MKNRLVLEALCGSADDAVAATKSGADRIELNSCLGSGGLTPTAGSVRAALERGSAPIIAMLRPRPAGFAYSDAEFDAMRHDARDLVAAGARGLVFGILTPGGMIDAGRCARLMETVPDAEWVFHRAFDLVPDPFAALETLISLGVGRVLTKGQANSFENGERLLIELRDKARGRIEFVVPGVRPHNVARIVSDLGFRQLHFGRVAEAVDPSNSARPDVYFGVASKGREHLYEAFDSSYFAEVSEAARAAAEN